MDISDIFKHPPPKRKAVTRLASAPPAKTQRLAHDGDLVPSASTTHGPLVGEVDDRFFQDGLLDTERNVLDVVDQALAIDIDELNVASLKKLVTRFEKSLACNLELRAKFPDNPNKFIQSEVDLDSDIRALSILATAPDLYSTASDLNLPALINQLLTHENGDIALAAVEVTAELLDDDVINPATDTVDASTLAGIRGFVDSLLDHDFLALFEAAFRRETQTELDEAAETISKYFTLLDALLTVDEFMASRIAKTQLLPMLLDFVRLLEFTPLSAFAVELLAIIVQNSISARVSLMVNHSGMELLLKLVSKYRKKDPGDDTEREYLANAFAIICSSMAEPSVQKTFRNLEGLELMTLLIKARRLSRTHAVRVLDFATLPIVSPECKYSELEATHNVIHFICETQGLAYIFPLFMQMDQRKLSNLYKGEFNRAADEEHVISVIVNLFRGLHQPSLSSLDNQDIQTTAANALARVVKKFEECNHAKLVQLASRFAWYMENVGQAASGEDYMDQLERGLFTLTQLAVLVAFITKCSSECAEILSGALLPTSGHSLIDVQSILSKYMEHSGTEKELALELKFNFS